MDLQGLTPASMVRVLKWAGGITLMMTMLSIVFRGPLFRTFFHFDDLRERHAGRAVHALSGPNGTSGEVPPPVEDCIDRALEETARLLEFTTGAALNDAAGTRANGKANCIGYAALFQDRCRRRLDSAGLADEWHVLHLRGRLFCGTFDTHRLFSSRFWKDHDICAVVGRNSGRRVFVDPSLFDAARIRRVSGPTN